MRNNKRKIVLGIAALTVPLVTVASLNTTAFAAKAPPNPVTCTLGATVNINPPLTVTGELSSKGQFGVAAVSDGPVVLLIGDVALAHDLGGLLAAGRLGLELRIVVLNNDGGGIFHFLPVSGQHDAFEEHIATPHGLRFEHAAALYGLRYAPARTARQLRDALGAAQLIEVHTDRAANLERHRRLADAGLRALGALSPTAPAASPAA